MATKKITDLAAITSLASTDVLPSVGIGTNTTYKITVQNLANSLTQVTSSISASYAATASIATSSSYALSASNARSSSFAISSSYSVSSSFITLAQTASYVQTAQTASFVVLAQTASFVTLAQTASFIATSSWARNAVTASYVQNAQTASYVLNAVTASYVQIAQTASFVATASWSINAITASFITLAQTASYVSGQIYTSANPALTASYALTASAVNTLVQNVAITGSLVVSGSNGAGVFSQGATIADYVTGIYNSSSYAVWRSPFSCSVVAMYGYREGGGTSQINAFKSGSTGYLLHTGSNISLDVAYAWKKSNTVTNTDYAPGDSLFVVISGSQGNNQIAVQVDFIRKF